MMPIIIGHKNDSEQHFDSTPVKKQAVVDMQDLRTELKTTIKCPMNCDLKAFSMTEIFYTYSNEEYLCNEHANTYLTYNALVILM
jgi:hypothetical protein